MKNHTKVYLEGMGYDVSDSIPCEVCTAPAVDIHHIECRGMGGSKNRDVLPNLMAVCRKCHNDYGDLKELIEPLKELHQLQINARRRELGWK